MRGWEGKIEIKGVESQKPKRISENDYGKDVKCTEERKIKPRKCLLDFKRMLFGEFSEQIHW